MSLSGLWSVALLLAGTALLIMVGLIIARSVEERRTLRHGDERRRLIPLLLGSEGMRPPCRAPESRTSC
jgi:hypothetical protein